MVQNKFHYAITGQTAAEIIYTKADRNAEHNGLTTWKNSPDGRIIKSDVSVAKLNVGFSVNYRLKVSLKICRLKHLIFLRPCLCQFYP